MRFIFIDEIQQQGKDPNFFGVSSLVVDSSHYRTLRDGVDEALDAAGWNRGAEFKGRYIFSQAGDSGVSVDDRIEIVRNIVSTTTAKKNARARLCFAHNGHGKNLQNYLNLVSKVVSRCPKPQNQTQDKALVGIYLDHTDIVKPKDVEAVIVPILETRYLKLVETPVLLPSSNSTAGLIAADVLAYLKSWDVLSPDPSEEQQASLFESSVAQLNKKKLSTIREILELIKQVEVVKD
jgi:hypothetical protein